MPYGKDQTDISKISEKIGSAVGTALSPFLDLLAANDLIKIGLRVTIDPENVSIFFHHIQNLYLID